MPAWLIGARHGVGLIAVSCVVLACTVDPRQLDSARGAAQPGADGAKDGGSCPSCASTFAFVGPGASCASAAECSVSAPECVNSVCTCSITPAELATDPKNCGSCGTDCGGVETSATCQQGRCIRPGEPGPNDVARSSSGSKAVMSLAAGNALVLKSTRYSLQLSAGQSPGGNAIQTSSRFRLESGLLGASN